MKKILTESLLIVQELINADADINARNLAGDGITFSHL